MNKERKEGVKSAEEILAKYTTVLTDGTKICTYDSRLRAMHEYAAQFRQQPLEPQPSTPLTLEQAGKVWDAAIAWIEKGRMTMANVNLTAPDKQQFLSTLTLVDAEGEDVKFAEWIMKNAEHRATCPEWHHNGERLTTTELYNKYKKEKN